TPSAASRSRSAAAKNPGNASPASCCREFVSLTSVLLLAADARRIIRSGRRWFPRKAPAPRTFTSGGEKKMAILSCPLPQPSERIVLAHGGGGRLTNQLIERVFLPAFANPGLESRHDGAVISVDG